MSPSLPPSPLRTHLSLLAMTATICLGDTIFPYRQTILFNFPRQLCSNFIVAAHTVSVYILGLYSIYSYIAYRYELSIMQQAEPNGEDVACLPSSPASALNSLTISTIKMCQKIFQFPYTQKGIQGREGKGSVRGTGRRLLLEAYTFQFS